MKIILKYKKRIIVGLSLLALISIGSYYIFKQNKKTKVVVEEELIEKEIVKEEKNEVVKTVEEFSVDIKGEVNKAGVYKLPQGSLVIDVINVAGGLKKNANTKCINLSKEITNGMVIYVHSNTEVNQKTEEIKKEKVSECICPELKNDVFVNEKEIVEENSNSVNTINKVNINKANASELQTLSGIGEAKANDIVLYRESNGDFKAIEDIKNVSGIGDSIFNKIKDLITI